MRASRRISEEFGHQTKVEPSLVKCQHIFVSIPHLNIAGVVQLISHTLWVIIETLIVIRSLAEVWKFDIRFDWILRHWEVIHAVRQGPLPFR